MKISSNLQRLRSSLEKVDSKKVDISSIKDARLRDFAQEVAGYRNVGTGCAPRSEAVRTIDRERLEKAIATVAKELGKADANKDGELSRTEMKQLSRRAAAALGTDWLGGASGKTSSSCMS